MKTITLSKEKSTPNQEGEVVTVSCPISRRDFFSAMAMIAMFSTISDSNSEITSRDIAQAAGIMADNLMTEIDRNNAK